MAFHWASHNEDTLRDNLLTPFPLLQVTTMPHLQKWVEFLDSMGFEVHKDFEHHLGPAADARERNRRTLRHGDTNAFPQIVVRPEERVLDCFQPPPGYAPPAAIAIAREEEGVVQDEEAGLDEAEANRLLLQALENLGLTESMDVVIVDEANFDEHYKRTHNKIRRREYLTKQPHGRSRRYCPPTPEFLTDNEQ